MTVAQRWKVNPGDIEAEIEVLSEPALLHGALDILVRRRDDAKIHRVRLLAAQSGQLPALDGAEDLRLALWAEIRDLIQENRPAVRQLQLTWLA